MAKEEKTLSDNELIAEFDGWVRNPETNKGTRIQWLHPKYSTKLTHSVSIPTTPENMKYATSWDWLMPVVEKVYSFCDQYTATKFDFDLIEDALKEFDRDGVYKAVVEFIKWYNKQIKE